MTEAEGQAAEPQEPRAEVRALPKAAEEPVLRALTVLANRIGDLEDAVAEAVEELTKVRKSLSDLKKTASTKKQVKKLKKVLDQLDVIDVGPGDDPEGREDRAEPEDEAGE